jgi:hypothetical protein
MRKIMMSLAAAGTALAFATPAAAQYYPQPQVYPQQQPYGYNGYAPNNYGQLRALQARIDMVQRRIDRLDRRGGVRGADRLRDESRNIERRLRRAARNGLNPYEANDIQNRLARLEQRVNYVLANRYGGYGNGGYGNGYGYADRDRDGRDDRYEDDRGHDRDD